MDADLAPLQADIKDSAVYIANRKAYQAYDEEDTKPYKYQFRTRRRKNDEETPEKRVESAVQELPLIEPKVRFVRPIIFKAKSALAESLFS